MDPVTSRVQIISGIISRDCVPPLTTANAIVSIRIRERCVRARFADKKSVPETSARRF